MSRFTMDHKFSEKISRCFADMGVWDFINPIASQPWGGRNRVIARIRVFEKYLEPEDVLHGLWLQRQARLHHPGDWHWRDKGIEYLNSLLLERSAGRCWDEMVELMNGLPSVMEYASAAFGHPGPPAPSAPHPALSLVPRDPTA